MEEILDKSKLILDEFHQILDESKEILDRLEKIERTDFRVCKQCVCLHGSILTSEVVLTSPAFIRGNADLELVSYGGYQREKSPRSHNTESQTGSQISNSCSCPQQHLEVPPPLFRSLKNTLRS